MIKNSVLLSSLTIFLLSGCSDPFTSAAPQSRVAPLPAKTVSETKLQRFHTAMIQVAKSTKNDPNYHRIALNTQEEKKWFKDLMYRLWDRQITRDQFIAEGVARYPSHRYEFAYIANAYQNY